MTITSVFVNSCASSFPLGLGWVVDNILIFLLVHMPCVLCALLSPAPDWVALFSKQKCFNSVCVCKSLSMVYSLWDEPAAGTWCRRLLASSSLQTQ